MEEGTLFISNLDDYNIGIDLLNQLIEETFCKDVGGESSFVDELIVNADHDQIGINNTANGYSADSSSCIALPVLDTKMCVSNDEESMLFVHETCNAEDCTTRKPSYDSLCSYSLYREDSTNKPSYNPSYNSLCSDSIYREDQEKKHVFQYSYIDIEGHGKNCHINGEDSIVNTPTIYNHNYLTRCNDHIGEQVLRANLGGSFLECRSPQYKTQSYYYNNVCAQETSPSNSCSWENSSCNSTSTSALQPIKLSSSKKRSRREANLCTICSTSDHECVCDDQCRSLAISRLGGVCTATTTDNSNERSWREVMYVQAALQVANWQGIVRSAAASRPKRRHVRISSHPQTAAARHRRERISLRFRVLQQLVPGGTHMDNVSLLDETIHYLKFLKAQLQALECLQNSFHIPPSSISSTLLNSYAIPNELNSIALCSY